MYARGDADRELGVDLVAGQREQTERRVEERAVDPLTIHVDELRVRSEALRVGVGEQLGIRRLDPLGHVLELFGRRVRAPLAWQVHAELLELESERDPDGPRRAVPQGRVEVVGPDRVGLDHVRVAVDDPQVVPHGHPPFVRFAAAESEGHPSGKPRTWE